MFKVGPPDREPLDPSKWKIREPKSGTRSPVILQFPGSVDHALALRMIHVTTASGRIIPGQPALEDEERRWSFKPQAPWSAGSLSLLVETTLEDMAGNNIGKPFEVDLFEGTIDHITNSTIKLPFQAR